MHEDQLAALAGPILAGHGLELDSLDVTPMGKRKLLRITVDGDGPEGRGPLLDDISAAAGQLSAALDESDAVGAAPYTLEVTSRGVSKPLTEAKHYRRNTGRLVKLWLPDGEVTGRIVSASDDAVTLDVDGATENYALADIRKAVVQVELNPPRGTQWEDVEGDADDDSDEDEEA